MYRPHVEEATAALLSPETAVPTSSGGHGYPRGHESRTTWGEPLLSGSLSSSSGHRRQETEARPRVRGGPAVNTMRDRNAACKGGLSGPRGRHSQWNKPSVRTAPEGLPPQGVPGGVRRTGGGARLAWAPPEVHREIGTDSAPVPAKPTEAALQGTLTLGAVHTDTETGETHLSRSPQEPAAGAEGRCGTLG